jgi:alkyldihydroxyacetonephosphate synthase
MTLALVEIDETSLIADIDGTMTIGDVEQVLLAKGLTLGLDAGGKDDATIASWIAEGLPGTRDPYRDPVDHVVVGLRARLRSGEALDIRPGPRRAVGPDLVALFVGMRERFGTITRAHVRAHRAGVPRPEAAAFMTPEAPPPSPAELSLLEAVLREIG